MKVAGDGQIGVDIVKRAWEEPIRQIVVNSGTEGASVVERTSGSTPRHETCEDGGSAGEGKPGTGTKFRKGGEIRASPRFAAQAVLPVRDNRL